MARRRRGIHPRQRLRQLTRVEGQVLRGKRHNLEPRGVGKTSVLNVGLPAVLGKSWTVR